jgi:N-acetylgalactosamine-N,N'-diacetylbacillosaminyl-diphospho-undecaprenol 4-alpha-N-acetylgalactosaminyltransferase
MNSKKKIVLFTATLGFGGTERVVSLFCNALTRKYDVTLILIYDYIDFYLNDDVKLIVLTKTDFFKDRSNAIKRSYSFFKFVFLYLRAIKNEDIDIAISFLPRQNLINSITKILSPRLKTVLSERSFPSKAYNKNKTKFFLVKNLLSIFYNRNNALFSNSVHINEDLKENFNIKINSSVIYNPIREDFFQKSFLQKSSGSIEFNVITVGRLLPVKNHKSLIHAINMLPNNYQLDIYGNGNLNKELDDLISGLNLFSRVRLKGTDPEIKNRLIEYHCFVLSSLHEGFPNALLEAMAVGLPVISTNCMSGPLELLNDNEPASIQKESYFKAKYGLLVNVDDPIGLSKAINYFNENEHVRKDYSDKAFKKAKKFNIKNITLNLNNLIESLE